MGDLNTLVVPQYRNYLLVTPNEIIHTSSLETAGDDATCVSSKSDLDNLVTFLCSHTVDVYI